MWKTLYKIWIDLLHMDGNTLRYKRMRKMNTRRKWIFVIWIFILMAMLSFTGLSQYFFATSFTYYTHWGPEVSLNSVMKQILEGQPPNVPPINEFIYPYTEFLHREKCDSVEPIRLVYLVKSEISHFAQRKAIRQSWGFEKRFSDVEMRTIFLIGMRPPHPLLQNELLEEDVKYGDIVQADFIDSYFNNTLKTMMGLHWAYHHCAKAQNYLFVDDDYYVSTRNVLRFLRDPAHYPEYLEKYVASAVNEYLHDLFGGFVFPHSSPIRWIFSKWYVPLSEYPYAHWPPYVTAGAYVLSRQSLAKLYCGSLYTKPFRFDDIFLGMAARRAGLTPFHHRQFYFHRPSYNNQQSYQWVIASHGFDEPEELKSFWEEQRAAGNA